MIALTVNGKRREAEGPVALLTYLESLSIDARAVAVEVNDRILDRGEFRSCVLEDGDRVEIVRMVGGGQTLAAQLTTSPGTRPPTRDH